MARNFVGIDFGSSEVKMSLVAVGLRRAEVVAEDRVVIPDGEEDCLTAGLEMAIAHLRERNWLHFPIGVVVPAGSGSYRLVEFPFGDLKRMAQVLPFEIEGKFALPVEDLVYDHLGFVTPDKRGIALVTGVRKEIVDRITGRLKAANADVRAVTVGPMAFVQLSAHLSKPRTLGEPGARAASMVIDMGHRYCEVVALGEKDVYGARSFRFGGHTIDRALRKVLGAQLSADELLSVKSDAERVNLADANPSPETRAVINCLDQFVREVSRTRQYFHAEGGVEIVEICLSGGSSRLHGLEAWLADRLSVVVERIAPHVFRQKYNPSIREWPAFGAALAAARRPVFQLYDVHGRRSGDDSWIALRMPALAYLAAFVVLALAVETLVQIRAHERQRDAYAAELSAVTKQVFGASLSSGDQVREILASVESGPEQRAIPVRGAADVLAMLTRVALPDGVDSLQKSHDNTGSAATSTSTAVDESTTGTGSEAAGLQAVPAEAGIVADDDLYFSSVDIRDRKMSLNVAARRASARDRLKRKLESIPCIKSVTVGRTRDRDDYKEFGFEIDHDCYNEEGVAFEP
jgi:Tfp pilus assembly PilM family ATPase